ncbi:MAG: hypothetical protein ACYDDF_05335 [Thermoplasmatota archaeon]
MQKSIRRGLEEDAAYWAILLGVSGYGGAMLKRLRVITHEDVGAVNPINATYALLCLKDAEDWYFSPTEGAWTLPLTNAVLALCRGPHSRDADNLQAAIRKDIKSNPKTIPDYALDNHTLRGKQMGRSGVAGEKFFFDVGGQLSNDESNQDWRKRGFQAWCEEHEKKEPFTHSIRPAGIAEGGDP